MKKVAYYFGALSLAVGGMIVSAASVFADVPSASSTMDTIMGVIITTTVDLATSIFTTYWPYILVFGAIVGLIGVFKKFVHQGTK